MGTRVEATVSSLYTIYSDDVASATAAAAASEGRIYCIHKTMAWQE